MKLGDLIVFLPGAFISTLSKMVKTQIPEETKNYIEEQHLYHCTAQKETAQKIVESRILKTCNRYSKKYSFLWKSSMFYVCRFTQHGFIHKKYEYKSLYRTR